MIKDGHLVPLNFLGFLAFTFIIFLNQNLINMTIWTAGLANVNAGVVTVIWSAMPIFNAIADYLLFKGKLERHHWIGMIMIIICSALISLKSVIL